MRRRRESVAQTPRAATPRKFDPPREVIAEAAANGPTLNELAELFGVNRSTVRARMVEHGIPRSRPYRPRGDRFPRERVAAAVEASTTVREAAGYIGLGVESFRGLARKFGIALDFTPRPPTAWTPGRARRVPARPPLPAEPA